MDNPRELIISSAPFSGESVVYIMSRDQRVNDNHALLAAQSLATQHQVPLYVLFVVKKVTGRSREHYQFMLNGLKEIHGTLSTFGIPFILRSGTPKTEILAIASDLKAGALFFDFHPLNGSRQLIKNVARNFSGSVSVIDTHNIVPAWITSDKQEFAAHTIRRKIHKQLSIFLVSPAKISKQTAPEKTVASLSFEEVQKFVHTIPACGIKVETLSGEQAAHKRLEQFIETIDQYAYKRNDIAIDYQSGLSPYLHYGQISSLRVALQVIQAVNQPPLLLQFAKLAEHGDSPNSEEGMNALLEELIVRKELADNFCFYSEHPRSLKGAATWALQSLDLHASDARNFIYTTEAWENAATHDEIWNAAQRELVKTGKMHGYMRMYWAKKMLEWSASPEQAITDAVYLNDKYSIDGGDPNGYVGILWSIAGLHDRPWFDRPIYGKIRYMNDAGLRRKFNVDAYIKRINSL